MTTRRSRTYVLHVEAGFGTDSGGGVVLHDELWGEVSDDEEGGR